MRAVDPPDVMAFARGASVPSARRDAQRRARAALLRAGVRASGARRGLVLVYHAVALRTGDPAVELAPAHAATLLEAHLAHLVRHYRVVAASELLEAAQRRRRGEPPPVALTFDDDCETHATLAAPLLERHGVAATFFLTGAGLAGDGGFWWGRLERAFSLGLPAARRAELAALAGIGADAAAGPAGKQALARAIELLGPERRAAVDAALAPLAGPEPALLGAAGVRRLLEGGHEIGFHTRRHHRLTVLDDVQLAAALRDGRELFATVGASPRLIAYPHGRADARVAAAARAAGWLAGFTTEWHAAGPGTDPHLVPRLEPPFGSPALCSLTLAQTLARPAR